MLLSRSAPVSSTYLLYASNSERYDSVHGKTQSHELTWGEANSVVSNIENAGGGVEDGARGIVITVSEGRVSTPERAGRSSLRAGTV